MPAVPKAYLQSTNGKTSATLNVAFPTAANSGGNALQIDDYMVVHVAANSGATGTITPPSGWAPINGTYPTQTNSGNNSGSVWIFGKFATSADISASNAAFTSSYSTDWVVGYLQTFSGVDKTAPVAAYSIAAGGSSTNKTINPGNVVSPGAGCIPLLFSMNSNNGSVPAAGIPAGFMTVGYYYPENNLRDSYLMIGAQTTGTETLNPGVGWDGQYSQFAEQASLVLLRPATIANVSLQAGELTRIANAMMGIVIEDAVASPSYPAVTFLQAMKVILALMCGVDSGASSSSPVFMDPSGTRTRVSGTLDGSNNRTAVTLNFT